VLLICSHSVVIHNVVDSNNIALFGVVVKDNDLQVIKWNQRSLYGG